MTNQMIGPYRVLDRIGDGGMGSVFHARDVLLERDVAIKILRRELADRPDLMERFRNEAVILARLNHPGIATLYGLFPHDAGLAMVMELVKGQTLEAVLRQSGRLPWDRATAIAGQILHALEYAHLLGIVHRDLKPANVMLAEDGRIKVMDFGIARVLGSDRHTRAGHVVGTAAYMAPEQIRGHEGDARTDLYALGVVLYEMIAGRPPFEAESEFDVLQAHVHRTPAPPRTLRPDLPEWLDRVILRALAKDPEDRFQTAAELRAALEQGQAAWEAIPPTRVAATSQSDEPLRRHDVRRAGRSSSLGRRHAVLAALALAAAVLTPWAIGRHDAGPRVPATASDQAQASPATGETAASLAVALRTPAAPAPPPPRIAEALPPDPLPTPDPPTRRLGASGPPDPIAPPVGPFEIGRSKPRAPAQAPPHPRRADPEAPVTDPTPPPAAAGPERNGPAASAAPAAITFDKVKLLVAEAGKARQIDVSLSFLADRLVVTTKEGTPLAAAAYRDIRSAVYSQSKHPRWKEGAVAAVAAGVLAAPVFFLKSTSHWLTLETSGDPIVLRLDKETYRLVLATLDARSPARVERIP